MIEVDGLTVRYGGVTSLDAMSLTYEQGTCGLIGPNGAGKTTFFNVLSGFVRPAAGSVRAFGADQRRLVEVARAVVGRPRLVLLDEPAAGLPDEETSHLAEVIRRIPEHTGALAILVDHDMSLVSACCATTAVLDFGKLIASGPTAAVLRDDAVIRAYLGVA